jgi:hypothetical protein
VQLQDWVTADKRYQAELAAAIRQHRPTRGIRGPGPEPGVGPFCQSPQAFGIPASSLLPTPAGHS